MRNTNVKSLLCIFILLLQGLCSSLLAYTLDYNAGNLINTGVRGTNPHRYDPDRTGVLGVSYNTSLRSLPSGGLCADTYDWRDNNTGWYESGKTTNTLQVLRELRDHNSWGVFTANARGICDSSGVYNYNVNLPQLAADWVRYINRIVRLYRWNGSSVTDINGNPVTITGEDLRVCNSILWGKTNNQTDFSKILPSVYEAALPAAVYWEIGNEPEINIPDGHFSDTATYSATYRAIRNAMKALDTVTGIVIKTGPCVCDPKGSFSRSYLDRIKADGGIMDFVSYHPYYNGIASAWPNTTSLQDGLKNMKYALDTSKTQGILYSPNLIASEYNPCNWQNPYSELRDSMTHALGVAESVFAFASEGLLAANFWDYPTVNAPGLKVFQMLQDRMGDRLVDAYSDGSYFRLYTTRWSSRSKDINIWGLNFSSSADKIGSIVINNLPTARSYTVTKRELRTPDANTTLTSPWTYFQDRSNFTVYDGGSAGTAGWRSFQYDDGESIYLPDASLDKAVLSFQVPRSGYYRINIRQRSGSSADNASLWYPNHQYVYKLDNGPVALAGDINTIYSTPDDWDYIWGIARSGSVYLMAGTNHTLEVSCNSGWSGIDWVSIKDEAGVDWVTTNLSCSRSGNSITINNNFKASTLSVITVHPIPPAGMGWVKNDFDGDGKADPTVVYTNSSDQLVWCTLRSMLNFNAFVYHTWGGLTFSDFPLSGDYDGDGITDLMIYRPISNASEWHGSYSASGFPPKVLGASYDKPLSMDSDGDGKTDMRIYRPWDPAQWHGLTSSSGFNNWFPVTYYGGSADIPVPGDYDGDGIMDYAYCNSTSNGLVWNITFSSNGTSIQRLFGRLSYNDKPFAADFDGDGKSDIALYRPWYPAEWHCMTSSSNFSNYLPVQYYGYPIDIPTPGDYDGDGKADISVYRPATGEWYFKTSSNGWELKYVFPQPGGSPVGH